MGSEEKRMRKGWKRRKWRLRRDEEGCGRRGEKRSNGVEAC